MSCAERLTTFRVRLLNLHVRVTETNEANLVAYLCEYCKLLRTIGSSLRFVVAGELLATIFNRHVLYSTVQCNRPSLLTLSELLLWEHREIPAYASVLQNLL